MLDDFVDVIKDEKEIMHLWNSFVRIFKNPIVLQFLHQILVEKMLKQDVV